MQLCGDPTCESQGCSSEALDAYLEQQWIDAGEIVAEAMRKQMEEL